MGVCGSLGCPICALWVLGWRGCMAGEVWLVPRAGGCRERWGLGGGWTGRSGGWLAADHEQVAAGSEDGWFRFGGAGCEQDGVSGGGVVPSIEEVPEPPGRALYAEELDHCELDGGGFLAKFVGVVEVGGGEPVRAPLGVAVLAVSQVLFDEAAKVWIEEELAAEAVDQRGEPGDCGHEGEATWPQDASGFFECLEPVVGFGEVVERPEEKHRVGAVGRDGQRPRVADLGGHVSLRACESLGVGDVVGHW